MSRNLVLAITGASGAVYAVRLLDVLVARGLQIHLVISPAAKTVIQTELGLDVDLQQFQPRSLLRAGEIQPGQILFHQYQDLMSPIASGSFLTAGMVICPCSGGTLASVAHGASGNLIERAAAVHLKERRKLILVPRETPLSLIFLDNMRRCVEAGAVMLPAMPGFYHGAQTIADLVDFIVARICDQLGIEQSLVQRWGEE
ncbi:MAG: UbiX family flavin prenyltransferase [Planctomycetes bacterium]|nr:UbiX family flavin prenyltransferase [Planctomycetota bacterium]